MADGDSTAPEAVPAEDPAAPSDAQAPNTDAAVEEVVSRVEAVRIVVPQMQRSFIPSLPKSLQEQLDRAKAEYMKQSGVDSRGTTTPRQKQKVHTSIAAISSTVNKDGTTKKPAENKSPGSKPTSAGVASLHSSGKKHATISPGTKGRGRDGKGSRGEKDPEVFLCETPDGRGQILPVPAEEGEGEGGVVEARGGQQGASVGEAGVAA